MSKKSVKIRLNEITINKENFRHSPLNNELEAIHYLITEDYESYLNLAKEMQKDCRTFTALLLEKDGNRILMDANRRVSVLKVFENPNLIPNENRYDDLKNLCVANGPLGVTEITADIYYDTNEEDKENLMSALNELHVKDNNTRKDWNALSQYRASQFIGSTIKHPWIRTLEFYGYSDEQIIEMTHKKTDIFNRLMRKNQLNILENGKIDLSNDTTIISEICKIVKNKAYMLGDTVQKVDTRISTLIYQAIIDDLIKKYSIGQLSIDNNSNNEANSTTTQKDVQNHESHQQDFDLDVESEATHENDQGNVNKSEKDENSSSNKPNTKQNPSKFRLHELYVAPASKISREQHTAFLNIHNELEKLAGGQYGFYKTYKLSTYYLIRALIEQCLKYWLSTYYSKIYKKCEKANDANLGKMIEEINKAIENKTDIFYNNDINRKFKAFFGNYASKDTLDLLIHHPYLLSDDINILHNYTSGILYDILNHILTYEEN